MLPLTIATYSLLGTGLLFSVIELGLSAYLVSAFGPRYECGYNYYTNEIDYCKVPVPPIVSFFIFTSVWSVLTTPFALVYPWLQTRKAGVSHESLNKWLAPLLIVLYFLTFIFWLAGFADIAYLTGGYVGGIGGVGDSVLAFGVLNWLIYMALFVLAILTVVDVLPHDLPGWQPMITRNRATGAPATYNSGAPTYNNAAPVAEHHIINEEPKHNATPEMVA